MQTASTTIIDLQIVLDATGIPGAADFRQWADVALRHARDQEQDGKGLAQSVEITVRVVDEIESRQLNHKYRDKDKATNVLSFPNELPDFLSGQLDTLPLGDLVICAPVVTAEAAEQHKSVREHWAHLTIHGVLHLLGFDHLEDDEAEAMEAMEISALQQLGISNPYETDEEKNRQGKHHE